MLEGAIAFPKREVLEGAIAVSGKGSGGRSLFLAKVLEGDRCS
ncbi:hypothetical protein [Leptolyngbya sp. CCY15150]|nr:hypothetical protein [Leptolyngbya sp. CCY15150]